MIEYVWMIPMLPLLAAVICGFAGRSLGERSGAVATAGMFATFLITASVLLFPQGTDILPYKITLYEWMSFGDTSISFGFYVDQLTVVMLLFISFVGSLVFYYASGYMHGDEGYPRFFTYLSMFAFSMYMLVLADNFLLLFVGWEGVGLCSYLLIGFWFKNREFASAGKKAFITNRVGDFGLLIAMFTILGWYGTLDFQAIKGLTPAIAAVAPAGLFILITLALFLGATGKSAQIPLYVWLPDAMAGPTPVSALIHAATMVTAGIYLIARTAFLFELAPIVLAIIAFVGAATAMMAALIACTQHDIKKVLAYSTVSQLGYMFMALGVSAYGAALFHVFTHAFFKGCLFLCAGSVIHAMHHEQDMRKMGGLGRKMPITAAAYLISTAAIAGIFPLSGFFSKDEILWSVIGQAGSHGFFGGIFHILLWTMGLITAGLTAFYMFRSYFMTFTGETRMPKANYSHVHESPPAMTRPLMVLAFGAAVMGILGLPGWLTHSVLHNDSLTLIFQHTWLEPVLGAYSAHLPHAYLVEFLLAVVSLGVAIGGLTIAYRLYGKKAGAGDAPIERIEPLYSRASAKFLVDELYGRLIIGPLFRGADNATRFDKRVIDGAIEWVVARCRAAADWLRRLQDGRTTSYALSMVVGLNLLIVLYLIF